MNRYVDAKGLERLCSAIVEQAENDYRSMKKILRTAPNKKNALQEKNQIARFFLSAYFEMLTNVSGAYILKRLEEE